MIKFLPILLSSVLVAFGQGASSTPGGTEIRRGGGSGSSGLTNGAVNSTNISSGSATLGQTLVSDGMGGTRWATPSVNDYLPYAIEDFNLYTATNSPVLNAGVGWNENGMLTAVGKIVPRVFRDGITRNVLQFNGRGDYVRKMPWGTNWQELRISFVLGITNTGALFTNQLGFGIAAGTNSGLFQANNSNFIGAGVFSISGGTVFQYSNSLVEPYYGFASTALAHKTNIVTTLNLAGQTGSPSDGWAALPRFTQHIVAVVRNDYITNQLINLNMYGPYRQAPPDTSTFVVLDGNPSIREQLFDINAELTTGFKNVDAGATSLANLNTQERTVGKLDCIGISWAYSGDMILEVASIVVRKIR